MNFRKLALLLATTLSLIGGPAKAEPFELVTFDTPVGTRSSSAETLGFIDATPTTFVTYAILKSVASSGDPARDFQDDWNLFVTRRYRLTSELNSRTTDWPGGWKLTTGAAKAWGDQQRDFVALLYVFTGHGAKVSVMITCNDDLYKPKIDKFVASLRLRAPPTSPATPVAGGPASQTTVPVSVGGAAAGFTVSLPPGYVEKSGWYVNSNVETYGGGTRVTSVLARPLAAVAPQGNMGEALRALWQMHLPPEVKDRAGAMVYRRYVGDGIPAQFIAGKGRENGRQADTVFSLYLLDCGSAWQPLVIAQAYDEPGNSMPVTVAFSAGYSYGTSAQMAEPFLAAVRCASGKGRPLVDPAALIGDYGFGSGSSLQWVNVYTGAMSMTAVTYSGSLNLKADRSFDYKFQGASGAVGAMNISTESARGRWEVQGDLLVLTRDTGKQTKYRIAGLTQFPSGEKGAVFMSRLDLPVNPTTVTSGGDYYATKVR